jgi:spore cortex protein
MMGGLVGCAGNNDSAMDTRYNDTARPFGYYSNENTNRNGNARTMTDNDGPITEMLDRTGDNNDRGARTDKNRNTNRNNNFGTLGNNRDSQARINRTNDTQLNNNFFSGLRNNPHYGMYGTNSFGTAGAGRTGTYGAVPFTQGNNNYATPGNPYAQQGNRTLTNNGHGYADTNYHGHINDTTDRARSSAYYNNYNGELTDRIVERVERIKNVEDAHAVTMGDNVLVAIDTNDDNDKNVINKVEKTVKSLANGKDVRVVTDEATYTRVRDINNDMRNGETTRDTIDNDLGDLFENIGQTMRRPFQTNNR